MLSMEGLSNKEVFLEILLKFATALPLRLVSDSALVQLFFGSASCG